MNNYDLLGVVGQGQFGVAHKARNKVDGQLYCIKRIPMSVKEEQKASLKEAQLLSSLDHPNIIAYKECFVDSDESLCIVTSFCEEGDLFKKIKNTEEEGILFSENEIMDMFLQISSALMYIHGKKIMHRDLKTQNIFLARGGIIVLGDFGISKVLSKTSDFATTVTGTPYYMAPEICNSQPYTFKSDIWSLGCVLYELCTLKHAFAAESLLSLVFQIVRGNYPPIPTDKYSKGLSDLVNALLVRDAAQRPSLSQIFRMPYVHAHVQRFHAEERRRMERTAATMTKRKASLQKTLQDAKLREADKEYENLTPQQKKERRRDLENKKRELELQLATMHMSNERQKASRRKEEIIHRSNTGLPGSQPSAARGRSASPWELDDGTAVRGKTIGGIGGQGSKPQVGNDTVVNLDTMPGPKGGNAMLNASQYQQYENRPVGGSTLKGAGDTVLMGSVMGGAVQTRGVGGKTAADSFTAGAGDTMVNLGTMPSGRFKFGGTLAGSLPALPAFPVRSANSTVTIRANTPPARSETNPNEYDYIIKQANQEYRDEFSDYEDDDFDSWALEDQQDMVKLRMKILDSVQTMQNMDTMNFDDSMSSTMQESLNVSSRSSKAAVLRDKCQAALGRRFGDVYAYLRRVRTSGASVDEKEVQRRLKELVGPNPTPEVLQGCNLVDQLVFQESMYR